MEAGDVAVEHAGIVLVERIYPRILSLLGVSQGVPSASDEVVYDDDGAQELHDAHELPDGLPVRHGRRDEIRELRRQRHELHDSEQPEDAEQADDAEQLAQACDVEDAGGLHVLRGEGEPVHQHHADVDYKVARDIPPGDLHGQADDDAGVVVAREEGDEDVDRPERRGEDPHHPRERQPVEVERHERHRHDVVGDDQQAQGIPQNAAHGARVHHEVAEEAAREEHLLEHRLLQTRTLVRGERRGHGEVRARGAGVGVGVLEVLGHLPLGPRLDLIARRLAQRVPPLQLQRGHRP
mmetsp:Transcript_130861/g.326498  ORF Transcript_130861/g.326498 Transcript_130861/m.326498 type:complete len:295 (+) Transcript_130861:1053-1937(+)